MGGFIISYSTFCASLIISTIQKVFFFFLEVKKESFQVTGMSCGAEAKQVGPQEEAEVQHHSHSGVLTLSSTGGKFG